jgi:hypothetical protein
MCTKWTKILLVATLAAASPAFADDAKGADPATKTLPAKASDTAKASAFGQRAGGPATGADPASKALPANASDTAKANAFGQQGERSKAAHQAAHAAATQQAHAAAAQAQAQPATTRPSAAARSHASATGVTSGFDRATAGAANGQGAAAGQSATPGQGAAHRH